MFGAKLNGDVEVYVGEYQLSGIDNAEISYSQQQQTIKPLGTTKGITTVAGETQKSFSFSRYLIYEDPIIDYISGSPIKGQIVYEDKSYGFESGYLNSYSVNCAVGSVPRVSSSLFVADDMVTGEASATSIPNPIIDIPKQGSISVTCDKSSSNRVIGFDYSISTEYVSYYTIGSIQVNEVEIIPPILYSASVQIDVDDSFMEDSSIFFTGIEGKTVSFSVDGRNGTSIQSLTIPNATLIGENLSMSADGSLILTLNYVGHGY